MNMNKSILIGRVATDLQLNQGQNPYVKFTLAVDRMKKGEADFIRCTAFGKTAETLCRYSGKGKRLGVEGHIQTGSYSKQDGSKVYTTDVIVDRTDIIDFLDQPTVQTAQTVPPQYGAPAPPQYQQATFEGFMEPDPLKDEGIPFLD